MLKNALRKLNLFGRSYEGASKNKRLRNWKTDNSSANSTIFGNLETLRDRARYLRRNNPFAARGLQAISSNTVGRGIQTQFRNAQASDIAANPAEILWKSWANTKAIDYEGRYDIFGLQRVIIEAVAESGEVLIRKKYNRKLPFPLQYQVLEGDFIDSYKNQVATDKDNQIIQGIEFDKNGKRIAYWLYENHPGGVFENKSAFSANSFRVSADEIFHIYRQERPGQARGVPWLAPVIIRLKDFDDYEDAQLMRQKVAACFTAFVQDIGPDSQDLNGASKGDVDELSKLEPATIEFLPAGKTITFANPQGPTNYDEYTKNVLRSIAAGLGITYEILTGDLSNVNFSSARLGWIEFMRNLDVWRKDLILDGFLNPVVDDFKRIAAILGKDLSNFSALHTPPRREMIDPTKEIEAAKSSIRAGLSTWSDELMSLGKDPGEHFAQYAKDKKLIDSLQLTLDSDAKNGQAQNSNAGGFNAQAQN